MEIHHEIKVDGNEWFLFDAAVLDGDIGSFFNPRDLADRDLITGRAIGRGEAWFFQYGGHDLVLRHFRRGGFIGKFFDDQYLGWSPEESRSWREWRLLQGLFAAGLPVPRPVGASVKLHQGFYRADLITCRIPGGSLANRLAVGPLSRREWMRIGRTIARFHQYGVFHADLNASNILLDNAGEVFLIDFDRGEIRKHGKWQQGNLDRLLRSLRKFKGRVSPFHYFESSWEYLLAGYREWGDVCQGTEKEAVHS